MILPPHMMSSKSFVGVSISAHNLLYLLKYDTVIDLFDTVTTVQMQLVLPFLRMYGALTHILDVSNTGSLNSVIFFS